MGTCGDALWSVLEISEFAQWILRDWAHVRVAYRSLHLKILMKETNT